jgi:L-ascorbate metabolism protein UlaG (beta-lactamase superfamily)
MKIHFYGHAAFLIQTGGLRIILDPFRSPDSGGYAPIDEPADLVCVSHENDRYHSHLGQIRPPFEVVEGLKLGADGRIFHGIDFQAIRVFESPERREDDEVTILHFRAEGLHIVFLGDLGHALEEHEVRPIQGADVVLIPAGGPPTIDFPLIPQLIEQIQPRILVPMHYKTPGINLNIAAVERFFASLPNWPVEDRPGPDWEFDRDHLGPVPRIVWLKPSR